MSLLFSLIKIFSVPIIIVNMLGTIVAGIWLAILGEWGLLAQGGIALIVSPWLLAILLLPNMGLSAISAKLFKKNGIHKIVGLVVAFLGSIYVSVIIIVWCLTSLNHFLTQATHSSFIPLLIWSYDVATGPWAYFAAKEGPESFASSNSAFFTQLGYIAVVIAIYFFQINLYDALIIMCITMALEIFISFTAAIKLLQAE